MARPLGRGPRFGVCPPLPLPLWAGAGFPFVLRAVPQAAQNLACGRFSFPQLGQRLWSELPHSIQNLAPSRFSDPQLPQRIRPLYSFGVFGARKTLHPCRHAASFCRVLVVRCSPSSYGAPSGFPWATIRRHKMVRRASMPLTVRCCGHSHHFRPGGVRASSLLATANCRIDKFFENNME